MQKSLKVLILVGIRLTGRLVVVFHYVLECEQINAPLDCFYLLWGLDHFVGSEVTAWGYFRCFGVEIVKNVVHFWVNALHRLPDLEIKSVLVEGVRPVSLLALFVILSLFMGDNGLLNAFGRSRQELEQGVIMLVIILLIVRLFLFSFWSE